MERLRLAHKDLYNAALEERIGAYRKAKKSISFNDQCISMTQIRKDDPDWRAINAQSAQVTLKRLDLAFQNFFRRVKQGKTPGFPRFQGKDHFKGFGFKTNGDGFKFEPGGGWRNGTLRLSGIGTMQVRGQIRTNNGILCSGRIGGPVLGCSIVKRADGWYMSVVLDLEPAREGGDKSVGVDWGVETYLTCAYGAGDYDAVENDRLWKQAAEEIKDRSRALAKRKKRTRGREKARRALARKWRKLANQRKDRAHKTSAWLVREHGLIATESLIISNMTRSASGTSEEPGTNVAQKSGLNREILDTAPGSLLSMTKYKAEEAGVLLHVINSRKHKPSQSCPACGCVKKKKLSERQHICEDCGFEATRDQASALFNLVIANRELGPEWPSNIFSETPSIVAA